jgi:prolyl oligopeptidase
MRPHLVRHLAAALCLSAAALHPARAETPVTEQDPYLWLEGVTDEKALAWVKAESARTEAALATSPGFRRLEGELRAILDSDAKIPAVEKIGAHYYNFWKDQAHERGLWRRTTLAEYRKARPAWETVLDLDALNAAEQESWVWHGAQCLRPENRRCLVALSRGGSDADVTREFDLSTRTFVKDGFVRPEAKGGLAWIDRDAVYVYTDFGPGSLTSSGYPRVVKRWARGTPLAAATVIYQGQPGDMYIAATRDLTPGFQRDFVSRTLAFYADELLLRRADGTLSRVEAPTSAKKEVYREWLTLELRDPWTVGDRTYPAGALLATRFDAFMAGKRDLEVLFEPSPTTALQAATWTRHHLVLTVLDDVKSVLTVLTPGPGGWTRTPFPGAPAIGALEVQPVDADQGDEVWLTATGFLEPTTLSLATLGRAPERLKANPAFFDATRHEVEQRFATSKDGTRVPYFLVRPRGAPAGDLPTLLNGYGGFEVSETPRYSGNVGKGWLERGGAYALANIRGGGEYGPRWHQAALKASRPRAYEDFAAVAQDLVDRRVTTPARLGIMGGSNGGLLMGNMLTQYPARFGAVVVQVPLLDMRRYSHLLAGASWMAEYGDPDKPEEWAFIQTFSPYHLVRKEAKYPPTIFLTSTRDDRVHPGHARKMAARMLEWGHDVRYWENVEGGHGGAANNAQSARMWALTYAFLWERLAGRAP